MITFQLHEEGYLRASKQKDKASKISAKRNKNKNTQPKQPTNIFFRHKTRKTSLFRPVRVCKNVLRPL